MPPPGKMGPSGTRFTVEMDAARVQEALWRLAPVAPAHFRLDTGGALEDLRSRAPDVRRPGERACAASAFRESGCPREAQSLNFVEMCLRLLPLLNLVLP